MPLAHLRLIAAGSLLTLSVSSALLAEAAGTQSGIWQIDENSSVIRFQTRQRERISCRGTFKGITGSILYDGARLSRSAVQAKIDLTTIKSGITTRDRDLKSFRYMNVQVYPSASFHSTSIRKVKDGYVMHGDFQLHGITQPIDVNFSKPTLAEGRLHVSGNAVVLQHNYGLSIKPLHPDGVVWINDPIEITVDITALPAVKGQPRH